MESKDHFFGDWVSYYNDDEKIEALEYLRLWKKFFLRKVKDLELVEDQIIDKHDCFGLGEHTIGMKIRMHGKKPKDVLDLSQIHPI